MQGMEFETDNYASTSSEERTPIMLRWLSMIGINDTATANFILISITAIFFGITIFTYAGALAEPKVDRAAEARAILIMQNSI